MLLSVAIAPSIIMGEKVYFALLSVKEISFSFPIGKQ